MEVTNQPDVYLDLSLDQVMNMGSFVWKNPDEVPNKTKTPDPMKVPSAPGLVYNPQCAAGLGLQASKSVAKAQPQKLLADPKPPAMWTLMEQSRVVPNLNNDALDVVRNQNCFYGLAGSASATRAQQEEVFEALKV